MLVQVINGTARAAVLFGLLTAGAGASEMIYKSVNEEGNVEFSQRQPAGKPSVIVTPRYAGTPAAESSAPAVKGGGESTPGTEAAAAPPATEELTPEQVAIKQKNCAEARDQLAELNNPRANRLQYTNEKDELAFLTPEQLQVRLDEANAAIEKYCD